MTLDLRAYLQSHLGLCWRVVETQEVAATRAITSSADEQQRLETLLDMSKPTAPTDCDGLSYLLMTPFRYPPLPYGSRFGSTQERGIFYGASTLATAFAETSVYFWLFQSGPTHRGAVETVVDQRTAFSVRLSSTKALDLARLSEIIPVDALSNPSSWEYSQTVGNHLRAIGAEFFWYPSARLAGGRNIAVISPKAFASPEPDQQMSWHIRFDSNTCWFGHPSGESYEYQRHAFEQHGSIPHPAYSAST